MFHKTVHKAWNFFNLSEQSPKKKKNYAENSVFEFRLIEQKSNSDRTIQKLKVFFFTILIDRAKVSTNRKMINFEFSLRKFQNLNFHFNNFMKQYFRTQTSSLLQPILVYTYIYNIKLLKSKVIWILHPEVWNLDFRT